MKRVTTYIISFMILGLLGACKDDALQDYDGNGAPDAPVTLNFGLMIPQPQSADLTRAMFDNNDGEKTDGYIGSLKPYLFIFEDTGSPESNYLRTLVHGDKIKAAGEADNHDDLRCQKFSATVDGTAEDA